MALASSSVRDFVWARYLFRTPLDHVASALRPSRDEPTATPLGFELDERHRVAGGCFTLQALALWLDMSERRCAVQLDRWVSARRVLLIPQTAEMLLPIFQIDLERFAPFPAVSSALAELADVFSDVEVCDWFVTPNLWLADEMPAQLVADDPRAVVGAARADRFIARGL
jgi:hypothetical protein